MLITAQSCVVIATLNRTERINSQEQGNSWPHSTQTWVRSFRDSDYATQFAVVTPEGTLENPKQ
jgi:hypothetical protein